MSAPVIEVAGLVVRAPVTTVTNAILATQCAAFASVLDGRSGTRSRLLFFLFLGLGALAGMPKHGIPDGVFEGFRRAAGVVSNMGVAVATTVLVVLGVGAAVARPALRRVLVGLALLQLVSFAALTIGHPAFILVAVNAAIGLTLLAPGAARFFGRRSPSSGWVLAGVVVVAAGAAIYVGEIGIGPWVNHVDVGHGFVALALFFLYRGALADDGASWAT